MTVQDTLTQLYGDEGVIVQQTPISGGDINAAALLALAGGQKVFIKKNRAGLEKMFKAEAIGLRELGKTAESGSPPTPQVLAWGQDDRTSCLLLQAISLGRLGDAEAFGRALALLHQKARQKECGFESDNWIGSTPQKNTLTPSWIDFFREHRLADQWQRLRKNGFGDARSEQNMQSILTRLPELLPDADEGRPSLLHGDLWGGNWLADEEGRPWLIDPAVYYGHREADIAMTRLFGGFPSGFQQGYTEAWPLLPGFSERLDLYNLYHLLNHVNLFGAGYWSQTKSIIQRYG